MLRWPLDWDSFNHKYLQESDEQIYENKHRTLTIKPDGKKKYLFFSDFGQMTTVVFNTDPRVSWDNRYQLTFKIDQPSLFVFLFLQAVGLKRALYGRCHLMLPEIADNLTLANISCER